MLENDYQAFGGNELYSLAVLYIEEDFCLFPSPWLHSMTISAMSPCPLIPILSDIN